MHTLNFKFFTEVFIITLIAGKIIKAFSLCQNFQLLMDTKKKSDEVSCLHGIRALNSLALLLSHKQMALLFVPYTNRIFTAQVHIHLFQLF